jgi:hypothetical protein
MQFSLGLIIFKSMHKLKTQQRDRIQAPTVRVFLVTPKMLPVTLRNAVQRISY